MTSIVLIILSFLNLYGVLISLFTIGFLRFAIVLELIISLSFGVNWGLLSEFFNKLVSQDNFFSDILFLWFICTSTGKPLFIISLFSQVFLLFYKIMIALDWFYLLVFVLESILFTHFLLHCLLMFYFFGYLFLIRPLSSKKGLGNPKPSKLYYISSLHLTPKLEKLLSHFNSNIITTSVMCSAKEFKYFSTIFGNLFNDSYVRNKRISFFIYVLGCVIHIGICKLKGKNFIDRGYFLKHFNCYCVCKFYLNESVKGLFFCDGVVLDLSIKFWLGKLDKNGVFKKKFLSDCNKFGNNKLTKTNVNLFISESNLLSSSFIFLDNKSPIHSDMLIINDLNLKDNDCVKEFISVNTKSLCLNFGLSHNDFLTIKFSCRTGPGYEMFLRNGGSF